jgi:hypothetical protein
MLFHTFMHCWPNLVPLSLRFSSRVSGCAITGLSAGDLSTGLAAVCLGLVQDQARRRWEMTSSVADLSKGNQAARLTQPQTAKRQGHVIGAAFSERSALELGLIAGLGERRGFFSSLLRKKPLGWVHKAKGVLRTDIVMKHYESQGKCENGA